MLGVRQSHIFPGLTAVATAIDAGTVGNVTAGHILAGTDPDRIRVFRVECDAANRVRVFVIEDRRPGCAAVICLPDTAAADGDVPSAWILRVDDDVRDSAGHHGRANFAHFKTLERRRVESRFGRIVVLRDRD